MKMVLLVVVLLGLAGCKMDTRTGDEWRMEKRTRPTPEELRLKGLNVF